MIPFVVFHETDIEGPAGMTWWLRALVVLTENLGLIPSTHMEDYNHS